MNNNDILRRIRFAFDFGDSKMMSVFHLGGHESSRAEISNWLKKDDDPDFISLNDKLLATFLNGFIVEKRGTSGKEMIPEKRLNNNIILRKLKIALTLKDHDMLEVLELGGFKLGKHELSAFFRRPDQQHYRLCRDQVLRKFLQGLIVKYRGIIPDEEESTDK